MKILIKNLVLDQVNNIQLILELRQHQRPDRTFKKKKKKLIKILMGRVWAIGRQVFALKY